MDPFLKIQKSRYKDMTNLRHTFITNKLKQTEFNNASVLGKLNELNDGIADVKSKVSQMYEDIINNHNSIFNNQEIIDNKIKKLKSSEKKSTLRNTTSNDNTTSIDNTEKSKQFKVNSKNVVDKTTNVHWLENGTNQTRKFVKGLYDENKAELDSLNTKYREYTDAIDRNIAWRNKTVLGNLKEYYNYFNNKSNNVDDDILFQKLNHNPMLHLLLRIAWEESGTWNAQYYYLTDDIVKQFIEFAKNDAVKYHGKFILRDKPSYLQPMKENFELNKELLKEAFNTNDEAFKEYVSKVLPDMDEEQKRVYNLIIKSNNKIIRQLFLSALLKNMDFNTKIEKFFTNKEITNEYKNGYIKFQELIKKTGDVQDAEDDGDDGGDAKDAEDDGDDGGDAKDAEGEGDDDDDEDSDDDDEDSDDDDEDSDDDDEEEEKITPIETPGIQTENIDNEIQLINDYGLTKHTDLTPPERMNNIELKLGDEEITLQYIGTDKTYTENRSSRNDYFLSKPEGYVFRKHKEKKDNLQYLKGDEFKKYTENAAESFGILFETSPKYPYSL